MLSTKDDKQPSNLAEKKKEILAEMRKFHQTTFDDLGIPNSFFICKLSYKHPSKDENIIALFLSEINKGVDVYIEFGDSMYAPQDPERRLYLYRYNPHFETEYEMVNTGGVIRYLVPVSDLIHIKNNPPESQKVVPEEQNAFQIERYVEEDIPLQDATIRDLLAVMTNRPVSKKEWLNDLITKKS